MQIKNTFMMYFVRTVITLIIAGAVGTFLLFCVWLIPDDAIRANCEGAKNIFVEEGTNKKDVKFISYFYGDKLIGDVDMFNAVLCNEKNLSALQKAMNVNGYSRYWHGYLVVLRPVMFFYNYGQFRYIMFAAFAILCWEIMTLLHEKIGKGVSFAFLVSLIAVNFICVPFSFHVGVAFFITFGATIYILKHYDERQTRLQLWTVYLLIGCVTSYMDFLTTPITTLAMPLLVQILLVIKNDKENLRTDFLTIIRSSIAWGIGYAVFWSEKWLIGSLVLGKNVIADGLKEVAAWQTDSGHESHGIAYALAKNIASMMPTTSGIKELIPFLIPAVILLILLLWKLFQSHIMQKEISKYLPALFVAFYPYIWIIIIHNHSEVHSTFWVYRIQIIFVFGICSVYAMIMNSKSSKKITK